MNCQRVWSVAVGGWLALSGMLQGADFQVHPDVVYGHKAGMALTLDVVQPEKPNGAAVLFMVSGGWVSMWIDPDKLLQETHPLGGQLLSLLNRGYTVCLVRHGSSPYFKVPEAVDDVRRAVRYLRQHAEEYQIDPSRLGVMGGSAGGHLSLMLGTTADEGNAAASDPLEKSGNRVQAVVAIYPPTRIEELFPLKKRFPALDFDPARANDVSPLMHVTKDDAPTLLIHGDKDELVPISHSHRILEKFQEHQVPAELLVIEGAGHGFRGEDQKRVQEATTDWFDRYLSPKPQ